ncbi:MAG: citramalate synthase [Dehalococcoidia bacterium]|nr:citramalate synthase [Dehalococcoidia bacterium]
MSGTVRLYDTTLRDGAQREGISFSVADKLGIARKLDELGLDYIEGGWPGANPKDSEFFARASELNLVRAQLVAFGSTRRRGLRAEEDPGLAALISSGVKVATIVGKASAPQVTQVLEVSLAENLAMVAESVAYLKSQGMTVFFDAEHFFDGYKADRDYACSVLCEAVRAGADCLVLCDTNGGSLPEEVEVTVAEVGRATTAPLGIHAHNDAELAVAVTLAAVKGGAAQVQGTINGYGERAGNANLCSIIPALKLKMGLDCISDAELACLTDVSRMVSEVANLTPDAFLPYVGASAFSHKGGLHVSGMRKWSGSYQHIDPSRVGNQPRTLVSELAGRANIIERAKEIGVDLASQGKEAQELLGKVKLLESRGFQYENAQASFDLLVWRAQPDYRALFELIDFMVIVEKSRRLGSVQHGEEILSEAMVKVRVGQDVMHTAAEGDGPVNALDNALRKALCQSYPRLSAVKLVDYKVRILEESTGTESQVRVLIESSDGMEQWRTVGSSTNIIEASWLALADSLEYWLLKCYGGQTAP